MRIVCMHALRSHVLVLFLGFLALSACASLKRSEERYTHSRIKNNQDSGRTHFEYKKVERKKRHGLWPQVVDNEKLSQMVKNALSCVDEKHRRIWL